MMSDQIDKPLMHFLLPTIVDAMGTCVIRSPHIAAGAFCTIISVLIILSITCVSESLGRYGIPIGRYGGFSATRIYGTVSIPT